MEIIKRPILNGYMGVYCDIKQAEPITIAVLANETKLIEEYKKGTDIYISLAKTKWKQNNETEPDDTWLKQHRKIYKELFLSMLYGRGLNSIANSLNISVEQAKSFMEDFKQSIPNIMNFIDINYQYVMKNQKVNTILGENIPLEVDGAKTKSTNYVIQNYTSVLLASMFYNAIEKGVALGFDVSGKMFIHDSIVLEFPIKELLHIDLVWRKYFQQTCMKYFNIPYQYDWKALFNLKNQYNYNFDFEHRILKLSMWKEKAYYFLDHFRNGYDFKIIGCREWNGIYQGLKNFYLDSRYKAHTLMQDEYVTNTEQVELTLQILDGLNNIQWYAELLENDFITHCEKYKTINDVKKGLLEKKFH